MDNKSLFLHTPQGSKPFFKEEALLRSNISKKLTGFFEKRDFFPIVTPIIDYFDSYKTFFDNEKQKNCIRFIDQSGEVVLLRNDLTLFAAKMVASRSFDKDNVLKYYYADSIIRNAKSGNLQEHYQIGCEMVGSLDDNAETDILCTLTDSLKELGIGRYSLHIGDICVYRSIFGNVIPVQHQDRILSLIRSRDLDSVRSELSSLKVVPEMIDDIIAVSSFMGDIAGLEALRLNVVDKSVFNNIKRIVSSIKNSSDIVIDMSELSDIDYYNGIIFHVYVPNVALPVVSGGRYDMLFNNFGVSRKAIGFSYWLGSLEKALVKDKE